MSVKVGDRVKLKDIPACWFFNDGDTGHILDIDSLDNLGVIVSLDGSYDGETAYVDAAMCEAI
jgi:hypothetical protein